MYEAAHRRKGSALDIVCMSATSFRRIKEGHCFVGDEEVHSVKPCMYCTVHEIEKACGNDQEVTVLKKCSIISGMPDAAFSLQSSHASLKDVFTIDTARKQMNNLFHKVSCAPLIAAGSRVDPQRFVCTSSFYFFHECR